MKKWLQQFYSYQRPKTTHCIYGPITFMHALRGGAPVLKDEASWRTICGVMLRSRRFGRLLIWVRNRPEVKYW
jgi:hypothetical protein